MSQQRIATRLGKGIVTALLLSSALTFSVLYMVGRAERIHAFEQALADDFRTIANITQVYPDNDLYVNVDPKVLTDYLAGGNRFFQVWDGSDLYVVDRSPSLEALGHRFPHPGTATDMPHRFDTRLPDGRVVAMIWQRSAAQWGVTQEMLERTGLQIRDRDVHLLVGRVRQELDDSLRPLAIACAAGAILLPLIAAALLAVLVPFALRPLRELTEAIERRHPDDAQAFPPASANEVQLIVQRLNGLIERIASARGRERQFLVDTAHELRTPLAELHVVADVALLAPDDAARQNEALIHMRTVTRRMTRLVDALFRLARYERKLHVPTADVRLADTLRSAIDAAASASQQRSVHWQVSVPDNAIVQTDALLLRALIDNLVGNVVAHARAGSEVVVLWTEARSQACLDIRNLCEAEQPERMGVDRMGHGLTIALLYAQALALHLRAQRNGGYFEVTLTFKLENSAEDDSTPEPASPVV